MKDNAGETWQISANTQGELEVAKGNLIDAQVTNKASSEAKNDRALFDAAIAKKNDKAGTKFADLKYGAHGFAGAVVPASNRIASEAKAWINNTDATSGVQYTTASQIQSLAHGDTVLANGNAYKYGGTECSARLHLFKPEPD